MREYDVAEYALFQVGIMRKWIDGREIKTRTDEHSLPARLWDAVRLQYKNEGLDFTAERKALCKDMLEIANEAVEHDAKGKITHAEIVAGLERHGWKLDWVYGEAN